MPLLARDDRVSCIQVEDSKVKNVKTQLIFCKYIYIYKKHGSKIHSQNIYKPLKCGHNIHKIEDDD